MKRITFFASASIALAMLTGCKSTPTNISQIDGVSIDYEVNDRVTGDTYQVVSITTIPNVEYEIKLPNGKTKKIIDNIPLTLSGVADMTGKIIVPLEYHHIMQPANGYFLVEMPSRPENYHYRGVYYKDGSIPVPVKYHSLDLDPEGRGAIAKISNPDGRTQQIYAYDFMNGNKQTLLPFNDLSGSIRNGKIYISSRRNPENKFRDYYFDFSGNPIQE